MAQDKYANILTVGLATSAANTITFKEINLGISLAQRMGIVIDQVDYYLATSDLATLSAAGDCIAAGLTSNQNPTDLFDLTDRRILHAASFHGQESTSGYRYTQLPFTKQFFPPIIYAGPSLYFAVDSDSLASVTGEVQARVYYRFIDITAQEYLELAETFLVNS